jgi:hypothetical protein
MADVKNVDRYLAAVIAEYRAACAAGFTDEYAAKQALWKTAVVVCEVANSPEPWLSELRGIAADVLKPSRIESTIRSAKRRAGKRL